MSFIGIILASVCLELSEIIKPLLIVQFKDLSDELSGGGAALVAGKAVIKSVFAWEIVE
jgi:hypothetical protein